MVQIHFPDFLGLTIKVVKVEDDDMTFPLLSFMLAIFVLFTRPFRLFTRLFGICDS